MTYDIGDRLRLTAEFATVAGVPTNPTSVIITVTKPSETVETYYYNVGGEADTITLLVDPGTFIVDIDLDESGYWIWHCAGSGAITAVEETTFLVVRKRT